MVIVFEDKFDLTAAPQYNGKVLSYRDFVRFEETEEQLLEVQRRKDAQ